MLILIEGTDDESSHIFETNLALLAMCSMHEVQLDLSCMQELILQYTLQLRYPERRKTSENPNDIGYRVELSAVNRM